ncbi:MAG: dienelactone hydrolase family protein [Deltaproteobacteria bacterium]|nr:dienelactone hydrolase family protein [Deltaproteobacteria bacterium]
MACTGNGASTGDAGGDTNTGGDANVAVDAPASSVDPANAGAFAVTTEAASIPGSAAGRTLPATIYRPTGAPTPAPLVVVSPGFRMARTQYASYASHLASWGFVVILADYADTSFFPDHQKLGSDVKSVVDWALARADLAIAPAMIGAAGHSLGGKISVLAASLDPRIKAVVGWDPVDSNSPSVAPQLMTTLGAAVAVIGETTNASGGGMPCAPGAENFQQFYAASPSPALQMTMNGADHMDWVDDPSCGVCGFCTAGTLAPDATRTASKRLDVAWLRRHLLGDTAMESWLTSPPEVAGGSAQVVRK